MRNSHKLRSILPRLRGDRRSRRGSILILAIGILAVLTLAALGYMTIVRDDRSSANAYANIANFQQQVDVTTAHIRALLTADLFGNKVVTATTPESVNTIHQIWPRMFEDGEYWDFPSVSSDWLQNPTDPSRLPVQGASSASSRIDAVQVGVSAGFVLYPPAPTDDAWLASQEPVDTDGDGLWDTWPQITNLRSAWTWQPDRSTTEGQGYWRRDHGRYVDLAEWLARSQGDIDGLGLQRGDPGLDISDFDTSSAPSGYGEDNISYYTGTPIPGEGGPNLGVDKSLGAGTLGTNLRVYDMQMSRMQGFLNGDISDVNQFGSDSLNDYSIASNVDERLWADTDGDGRADARWQEIDALGELFGFKWVVAARIIDNSAMIDVNSSLEWQAPGDLDNVGLGRTPADIDVHRLLLRSIRPDTDPVSMLAYGHPDLLVNNTLDNSVIDKLYHNSRTAGWDVEQLFASINAARGSQAGWVDLPHDGTSAFSETTPLGAREREAFYGAIGSAPERRRDLSLNIWNEGDLRAHFGANDSRFLTKLESRYGQYDDNGTLKGYLPGILAPNGGPHVDYPEMESLGPLRSGENWRVIDTFGGSAVTPDNNYEEMGTQYKQQNKIDRAMSDIRRHLTTVSGGSDVSPVPTINPELAINRSYFNEKIRIDNPDLIRRPVADVNDLQSTDIAGKVGEFVGRAFESFVWALAPMATDIPMASGIDSGMIGTAAKDQANHYGGSGSGAAVTGPAPVDADASYAVLRAASLAVNLADALDRDDKLSGMKESPTIAHLFPAPPVSGAGVNSVGLREIKLDTRFSHGDIVSTNMNSKYTGTVSNGVTLIGLDRQPFLMEAVSLALYEDWEGLTIPGVLVPKINRNDPDYQVGSLMVFELGNPWPDPIDVSDYIIRVSDGTSEFKFPIVAETDATRLAGLTAGNTTIAPGQSKAFLYRFDAGTGRKAGFIPVWVDFWAGVVTKLTTAGDVTMLDDTSDVVIPAGVGPVAFELFQGAMLPVQLLYKDTGTGLEYLVDRMYSTTGVFPIRANDITLDPVPPDGLAAPTTMPTGSGRATLITSLSRMKGRNPMGGFPGYVIERSAANIAIQNENKQTWRLSGTPQDPIADVPPKTLATNVLTGNQTLNQPNGLLPELPSFQLFVPNGPLRSVAELHMLSVFTNMYINNGSSYDNLTALSQAHDPTQHTGAGGWTTVSEQLGHDENFFYDATATTGANPYLGVLDPTRYVMGGDLDDPTGGTLPDQLRVPLATRVFDCFTTLHGPERLTQGKINLNTAPIEVLESLPFMAPLSSVKPSISGNTGKLSLIAPTELSRANLIRDYRDLTPNTGFDATMFDARTSLSGITGLRTVEDPPASGQNRRGLVNVGELLAMTNYNQLTGDVNTAIGAYTRSFGELGADGQKNDGAPLSLRYAMPNSADNSGSGSVSSDFTELGNFILRNDYPAVDSDPQDDPEERLALARSALDIASTRSDVFAAWFILRAYDPEQIEAIQAPLSLSLDTRARLLDTQPAAAANPSPGLDPVYETRWLAVFDRSEVTKPNDRPRVLLLVELPIN